MLKWSVVYLCDNTEKTKTRILCGCISLRILAVDDDIVSRSVLEDLLVECGYSVTICKNGLEAWELFRKRPFRFIITDWMMPHLDGIGLCERIRKLEIPHYVYIIILTSKDQDVHTIQGLNAGADDFMCKPINIDELQARIRTGLRILQYEDDYTRASHNLVQSAKLAAVGQLAAGIAHEINTPIQFVGDNTNFLHEAFSDIHKLLQMCKDAMADPSDPSNVKLLHSMKKMAQEIDLEFLLSEIPTAFGQTLDGVKRVGHIVQSIKEFSHPGGEDKEEIDINQAIENTIEIARNEWKYVAEMKTSLSRALPKVPCYSGDIKQVMLNLVVNAAHAIEEVLGGRPDIKGTISIRTSLENGSVSIRVQDSGCGIPKDVRSRIFEPFYTTKEVGRGSGQGLAISHTIIVKKHGGTLSFTSQVGQGTEFILRLPLVA